MLGRRLDDGGIMCRPPESGSGVRPDPPWRAVYLQILRRHPAGKFDIVLDEVETLYVVRTPVCQTPCLEYCMTQPMSKVREFSLINVR